MSHIYVTKEQLQSMRLSRHPNPLVNFVLLPEIGEVVEVVSGPWQGSVGIIEAFNHSNAVVTLSIEQGESLTNMIYLHPSQLSTPK